MKKLLWDTNFWGVDFFQIEDYDSAEKISNCNTPCLIQSLVNVEDLRNIEKLESSKFHYKESKVTLIKERFVHRNMDKKDFQSISLVSLKQNKKFIDGLFLRNTRFDIFPEKKINAFYFTWIEKSIKGEMDDECIGLYLEEELAGFITFSFQKNTVKIGLLGVLPKFQGKGISKDLLNYVENLVVENKKSSILISTQGRNLKALNAYIGNSFKIYKIDHWYYYQKGIMK